VLEVLDSRYTQEFGGADAESTILDIDASNPRATLVADLSLPETLPDHAYDCFILTQTLQYVYDLRAAVASVHQVLRPGGVALVTVPSLSRIAPSAGVDGDFWRLTAAACKRLFSPLFGDVEVETYGNVLAGTAFLYGVAAEELTQKELSTRDEHYPVLVGVRAGRSA
jgi:SAM-dependent methyltransferase